MLIFYFLIIFCTSIPIFAGQQNCPLEDKNKSSVSIIMTHNTYGKDKIGFDVPTNSTIPFEENTSLAFADFAKKSFDQLNQYCRYPTLMSETWHLPECFETAVNENKCGLMWHSGEGNPISKVNNFYAAIEHFFEENQERYTIDCAAAQTLVALRYMGKKHEICPDDSSALCEAILIVQCSENPKVNLTQVFSLISDCRHYQNINIRHMTSVGCCGYFSNLKSYYLMSSGALSSQTLRAAHGLNVVSVALNENNEMTYTGFSPLFKDGPKTYKAIRDYLLHHLCEDDVSALDEMRLLSKKMLQDALKDLIKNQPDSLYQEFDEEQDNGTHGASVYFRFA